jgi:lysophospholipase L1-like esterase
MRKILFAIFVIMISVPLPGQYVSLSGEVKMLALGDSYTIGESVEVNGRWPHQLIDNIRAMGYEGAYPDYVATTGWTTRRLIQGISSMVDREKTYNLVSILIGVNNQYQGIDIATYEPDLRTIIDRALEIVNQDTSALLILSIPDYAYTPFGGGSETISREIDEYNSIKRRVAAEYQIAFVDITPISRGGLSNSSLVAGDGLHPSEVQYGQWVKSIIPKLRFKISLGSFSEQVSEEPISVYPNPARSLLYIDSLEEISRISIYNATGQVVSDRLIRSRAAEMDLSNLDSGIYVLWIYHADKKTISRRTLIVQAKADSAGPVESNEGLVGRTLLF